MVYLHFKFAGTTTIGNTVKGTPLLNTSGLAIKDIIQLSFIIKYCYDFKWCVQTIK